MEKIDPNSTSMYDIGRKIIKSAILMDESLAELLKHEVELLKKITEMKNIDIEQLSVFNNVLKNIILALTLTDDKLETGIKMCKTQDNQTIMK